MNSLAIWIVTWKVLVPTSCPPPPPDPYGRANDVEFAVLCMETLAKEKYFATEKEAKKFVGDAPKDYTLSDFQIKKTENAGIITTDFPGWVGSEGVR